MMKPSFLSLTTFFSSSNCIAPAETRSQDYLIGLRGTLVLQSFFFVFFQAFLPTALPDANNTTGPRYQTILRQSFSILFANEALIYSWVIFLSARTICIPYLFHRTRQVCASSIFRRCVRLWIPTFVAYSLAAAAFSSLSTDYITDFLTRTGNFSINTPLRLRNFLLYFNSLFEIFWVTRDYASQAANNAFPSGTLWIVSLLFQQGYTVYMIMLTVPYTRTTWRWKTLIVFIAAAYWVQSWAWYSVTALLIADAVFNMDFQSRSRNGFRCAGVQVPLWPLYVAATFTGYLVQFLFIAWHPSSRKNELYAHMSAYSGGLSDDRLNAWHKLARIDNYLIIVGLMLLVETFEWPRTVLRSKPLVALGRRSFSVFLTQSIIIYSAGIKMWLHLNKSGTPDATNTFAVFCVCVPLVALTSELFYRVVDIPSIIFAKNFWTWMTK